MASESVLLLPVAATPIVLVAVPGIDAGAKTTVPSRAEVAVDTWVDSRGLAAQRPWGGHGGVHA